MRDAVGSVGREVQERVRGVAGSLQRGTSAVARGVASVGNVFSLRRIVPEPPLPPPDPVAIEPQEIQEVMQ